MIRVNQCLIKDGISLNVTFFRKENLLLDKIVLKKGCVKMKAQKTTENTAILKSGLVGSV